MPESFKQLVNRKWEHVLTTEPTSDSEWKNIALRQEIIENNMLNGKSVSFEFPNGYRLFYQISGNKIVLCTEEGDLEIWDLSKKICLTTIESIFRNRILRFGLFKELLAVSYVCSPSKDYIQLWNIHTGKQVHRFDASGIWKFVQVQVPNLFVFSFEKKLSMWDIESGKKIWEGESQNSLEVEI